VSEAREILAKASATKDAPKGVICRVCSWLCDRFCPENRAGSTAFWKASWQWEREASNEWDLWSADSDGNHALVDRAVDMYAMDRIAALQLYREAAEAGSVWSMEMVGWFYDSGAIGEPDYALARDYYYRAVCAGSWTATIRYAILLEKRGYHEDWPRVLEDGVRATFIPAYFWLAWFRYKHSRTRKMCREVRPLLEAAARNGHPGAKFTIALWKARGRFGLQEIPAGFRMLFGFAGESLGEGSS
jgi:hypothetical protein